VTFTAAVGAVAPATGTPTGSVEFFDDGTSLGVVPLAGGTASLTTSALAARTHAITVQYTGDATFVASAGTLPGGQAVNPATTATLTATPTTTGTPVPTPTSTPTPSPTATTTPTATATATSTATASPTATATVVVEQAPQPKNEPAEPRRETEGQRLQREHTNAGNRDDFYTEGGVVEVRLDLSSPPGVQVPAPNDVPYIVVATRDGKVQIRLTGQARAFAGAIRVGDYVEVDGAKENEQLFNAETIAVTRGGQTVR
jgi:hypothetical protein